MLRSFGGRGSLGELGGARTLDELRRGGHAVSSQRVHPQDPTGEELDDVFALNRALAGRVRQAVADGAALLGVLGDCTSCLGMLAGLGGPVGIVWLDAHGDFNTPETTVTGFLGGMPLAAAVGRCWGEECASLPGFIPAREEQVILLARALDPPEAELLRAAAVRFVDGRSTPPNGHGRALAEALASHAPRNDVYLHLDLDVLDPAAARANRYAEPGGMTPEEVLAAIRIVGEHARIVAAAVSAYDAAYDTDGRALAAGREALAALADVMRGSR